VRELEEENARLKAELAKYRDAPVVAYRHLMEDGWEYFDAPTGDDCPKCVPLIVKPGTKLYTLPPTAEQIANETAEACAKYVNRFLNGDGIQDEAWIRDIESGIRRGAWKEFKNV
jgi:hypothetical protein